MNREFPRTWIFGLAWAFLLSVPSLWAQSDETNASPDLENAAKQELDETNRFREEEKLPGLAGNPKLQAAAREFAEFLAKSDKFSHDADDRQPSDRVKAQSYEFCGLAENIAYEFSSTGFAANELAGRFVEGWKKSPGHRKNMLDPDMTEIGIGVAKSAASGKYYAVQVFARPISAMIDFQIKNDSGEAVEYQVGDDRYTLEPRYTQTHQLCRSERLHLVGKEGEPEPKSFEPAKGDRFTIEKDDGKLAMRKVEKSPAK